MTTVHAVRDLLVVGLAVGATLVAWRRSVGAAVAVVLAGLVAGSSSLGWLKEPALAARWAALFTLAALVAWRLRRVPRSALLPWAYVAVLPAVCLVSVAWSVDPRLTFARTATFAVLLFVAGGCGILWSLEERERAGLADGIAVVSVAAFCASIAYALVSDRAYLVGDLRGILENPNGLGLLLGLTYPFVAAALEQHGLGQARLAPFCAYAAVAAVSDSRSGLGALLITGIGYELARRRFALAALAPIAAGLASVAAIAIAGGGGEPGLVVEPVERTTPAATGAKTGSPAREPEPKEPTRPLLVSLTGGRNEAWEASASLIADRPALGYGFGTADRLFDRYPEHTHFVWFFGSAPHNGYLHAVLELGALGLVLLIPLLGVGLVALRLLLRDDRLPGTCAALALLAGLAAGVVESAFFSAGAPWALLIWISAAMCLAQTLEGGGAPVATRTPDRIG